MKDVTLALTLAEQSGGRSRVSIVAHDGEREAAKRRSVAGRAETMGGEGAEGMK